MSETKFTPGPWTTHAEDLRGGRYYVVAMPTDESWDSIDLREDENGEANAALIAAAPELYEALRELRTFVGEVVLRSPVYDETPAMRARLDMADAALAKANPLT